MAASNSYKIPDFSALYSGVWTARMALLLVDYRGIAGACVYNLLSSPVLAYHPLKTPKRKPSPPAAQYSCSQLAFCLCRSTCHRLPRNAGKNDKTTLWSIVILVAFSLAIANGFI